MGIFGFRKKKEQQQAPAPKQEKAPEKKLPDMSDAANMFLNSINSPGQTKPSSSQKVWSEDVDHFLARKENAKEVKLAGKQEDLASYEVGNRC